MEVSSLTATLGMFILHQDEGLKFLCHEHLHTLQPLQVYPLQREAG